MINIKKAIFGSTCILGCQCDAHNDDEFVRMPRKEKRMSKRKEHKNMMIGMLVYILALTVLCVIVHAVVEDGEVMSAISMVDEEEIAQDATLLKPKMGGGSNSGVNKQTGQ